MLASLNYYLAHFLKIFLQQLGLHHNNILQDVKIDWLAMHKAGWQLADD